jgi:hypothetical protein
MSVLIRKWSPLRIVGALLVVVIAAAIIFVGWQYWLFQGGIFRTSSFNQQEWQSLNRKTNDFSCYRGGMAHDIRTNILRTGQSRGEVERLLGKADSDKGAVQAYVLGMCSRLRWDFDTLNVHFNAEEKLTSVHIVQH